MSNTTVILTATYSCTLFLGEDEYPAEWGGYCDPHNPWGTADDTVRDSYHADGDEPIVVELPIDEAVDFIVDFPGAVWDLQHDCDPSINYRTGVDTQVTLHVKPTPAGEAALALAAEKL